MAHCLLATRLFAQKMVNTLVLLFN